MAGYRHERVAGMMHRELSSRIRTDIKDPELTEVSITRVVVSRDLGHATAFFLPFGGGEVTQSLADALDRAGRRLRGPIGRALRLRTAPQLQFELDEQHEDAIRMSRMLEEIGRELGPAVGEE